MHPLASICDRIKSLTGEDYVAWLRALPRTAEAGHRDNIWSSPLGEYIIATLFADEVCIELDHSLRVDGVICQPAPWMRRYIDAIRALDGSGMVSAGQALQVMESVTRLTDVDGRGEAAEK